MAIGKAYRAVNRNALAVPHLERALALRRANLDKAHPDTLESMHHLGSAYSWAMRTDEAIALVVRGGVVPDVIIADYNLPGELTGAEVIARLRGTLRREIPAIILTGDISSDTLRKIADADCVYLSKPADAETLIQQVKTFLAATPQPDRVNAARVGVSVGGGPKSTIYVVDDDCSTREAMQELLQEHGHTAETYAGAEEFLAVDGSVREGCLVVDGLMPGMDGIALLQRLKTENRGLPAIMITGHGDVAMAVRAMKAGATDFLEKPVRPDELLASIERALERGQDLAKLSAWRNMAAERIAALSRRERGVLDLVVQGRQNKVIAHELGISQRTVENHRAAVMRKAGVGSLPDLIRLVMAADDLGKSA